MRDYRGGKEEHFYDKKLVDSQYFSLGETIWFDHLGFYNLFLGHLDNNGIFVRIKLKDFYAEIIVHSY